MAAFDASSMIHAWDNYPIENFSPLWDWLASEIVSRKIVISQIAYEEVDRKIPAVCGLPEVNVDCDRFINFVKESGKVFR